MNAAQKERERKGATRRDVYWVGTVTILVSVLAVVVAVVRTQQIADARNRDNIQFALERQADRDAGQRRDDARQRADTVRLKYSLAVSDYRACKRGNAKDKQLLNYVDSAVVRGTASLRATLASPTATLEQKQTALRNLAGAAYQAEQLHKAYPPEQCGAAPIRPPT